MKTNMPAEAAAREIVENIAYFEDEAAHEPERTVAGIAAIIQRNGPSSALEIARRYGQDDGAHHKAWVIDQMVRALTGSGYDAWIAGFCVGEDGPETYSWDEGIAP